MDLTQLSPDEVIYWEWGFAKLNATIAFTWVVMVIMIVAALLIGHRATAATDMTRSQSALEVLIGFIRDQIREISGDDRPSRYLPFIGTLFLFIAVASILTIVPGYVPPTASLSTTSALAIAVFLAVPAFAMTRRGWAAYLKHYVEPSPVMLPFNIIGDLSRTLALAVRLFGNMMSSTKIVAVLIAVVPFVFPIVFRMFGLFTGLIQAYIFAVLAMVYIASGSYYSGGEDRHRNGEPQVSTERNNN